MDLDASRGEAGDGSINDFGDHRVVPIGFLQLCRANPDGAVGRDVVTSSVQYLFQSK